jgi:DNA-binding CsgD family transcriptional regulator
VRGSARRSVSQTAGTTERERQVLTLVGRGMSNAETAEQLHVSAATVKTYMGRLLAKLGLATGSS